MGELIRLRQKNMDEHHTKDACPGMFHLKRQDGIQYPIHLIPLVLDNVPFVMCEDCQTAYFPRGFETWLETTLVTMFFDMGCSLPSNIYRMARHLTGLSANEIADELNMSRIRYQKFEQRSLSLDVNEEICLKLCLARHMNLDALTFRGITSEVKVTLSELIRMDVSDFQIVSWL